MRLFKYFFALMPIVQFGAVSVFAAPGDSMWILTVDTSRPYYTYSVCDTERNPLVGDSACLPYNESHCDTGALLGSADTQYINFDYTMLNGYAGFKIDWDGGASRFDATGFDSLVIWHKGPLTGETVTINFGASATCGQPTVFTNLGKFSGSSSWKREAFPVQPLDSDMQTQGLYEMQMLINDATKPTASGNFKLDNMFFFKNPIKDQASAPTPLSPPDSAQKQPLKVNLAWSSVPIATSYGVEVSTNVDFVSQIFVGDSIISFSNTIFNQTGLTVPSITVSGILNNSTTYYWQALSANAHGQSPWSQEWSFTTTATGVLPAQKVRNISGNQFSIQSESNGAVRITVSAPQEKPVTISLYSLEGELIDRSSKIFPTANSSFVFGSNLKGKGVYMVKIEAANGSFSKNIMIGR